MDMEDNEIVSLLGITPSNCPVSSIECKADSSTPGQNDIQSSIPFPIVANNSPLMMTRRCPSLSSSYTSSDAASTPSPRLPSITELDSTLLRSQSKPLVGQPSRRPSPTAGISPEESEHRKICSSSVLPYPSLSLGTGVPCISTDIQRTRPSGDWW